MESLAKLLKSDLSSWSIDELVQEIGPMTKGLKTKAPRFDSGLMIFRGRPGGRRNHLREIGYPAPEKALLGRANREGSPVFYGSTHRSPVFFEVDNQVGDEILVSWWRTISPLLVNHLGYAASAFEKLGSSRKTPSWDGKTTPQETDDTSLATLSALGALFATQGDSLYKITTAIAEVFMRPPLEGLLYPTIAMNANGDNLALKTSWVDANVAFVGAELVRIDAIRGLARDVSVVDFATANPDGSLHWKGRGPNWQIREKGQELQFRSEGGVWVARDKSGSIVGPS
jgi:hypothetical protein